MNKPCPEPRCPEPVRKYLWAHLQLVHGWQAAEALDFDRNYADIILPKAKEQSA